MKQQDTLSGVLIRGLKVNVTLNVDEIQMKFPYSKSLQNFGSLVVCRVTLSFVSAAGKPRNMPDQWPRRESNLRPLQCKDCDR